MILWETKPEMDKRLLELEAQGLNQAEIAQQLSEDFDFVVSRDSVKNRLSRVPRNNLADLPITDYMPYYHRLESVIRGDEPAPKKIDLDAYFESLGKGKKRALVIGDTHSPFEDKEKLQQAIDLGRGCDIVILNGDASDLFAISSFPKEKNIPLEVEIDGLCRFFGYLSSTFEGVPVIVVQSNHLRRVQKNIIMPMSLSFLVHLDLLRELARPFPNIVVWDEWFCQVNDSIFAHSDTNSKVPGKPVVEVYEWFLHRGRRLGVKPFATLVQAHTHMIRVVMEDSVKLFEGGCLCQEMPYTKRDAKYMRPQNPGCVLITWDQGKSILNQCREFAL